MVKVQLFLVTKIMIIGFGFSDVGYDYK